MAKTGIIKQFHGKNEKICRNLPFGRNLFVYLHRIVCLSCAIGEKMVQEEVKRNITELK
jgi:hypothetical protein